MNIEADFVHLARLALAGRREDIVAFVRRSIRRLQSQRPELAEQLKDIAKLVTSGNIVRGPGQHPIPVDSDTRMELIRREDVVVIEEQPVWAEEVHRALTEIVQERGQEQQLLGAGIQPSRSMLFVGPPGVGKTLAARWLAATLERPLVTLDLAAVMSSFLGRTGSNIRMVLDYAHRSPSVLLLDEFDAIAKRRDDATEVGELKRLVTVLLQAVDDWPSEGILIAATNHPDLLDPAVWRRFDRIVSFPLPSEAHIAQVIGNMLDGLSDDLSQEVVALAASLCGHSYSEVVREVNSARRAAVLNGTDIRSALALLAARLCRSGGVDVAQRIEVARSLIESGHSRREVARVVGISRDTIKKHLGPSMTSGRRRQTRGT